MTPLTLDDWRDEIQKEAPRVDISPYSHNIISLALNAIAKGWGDGEANRAIKDFDLESLGWELKNGVA